MNKAVEKNELLYTIRDYATACGMTPWWVHMRIKHDGLPYIKIGRKTFIPRSRGDEWLEKYPVQRGRNSEAA